VSIKYPYATTLGETIVTPMDMAQATPLPKDVIEAALGDVLEPREIEDALRSYGYHMTTARGKSSVKLPPYRNDLMHVVDLVEDVAISRGYDSFVPVMPSQFTVGALSAVEDLSDRIRDLMVGLEFQEVMSNLLGSRSDLVDRMRLAGSAWDRLVDVDNVMVQTYSSLRQWMIPSLLRVEEASSRAFFPHRIFEVGEVALKDLSDESGTRTAMMLGALIAHAKANFSEIHSCLDLLMFYLGIAYRLEPIQHPSFLDGRAGRILLDDLSAGVVGELHPEVLEAWQVLMPCVAFEVEIEALLRRAKS
jgi:phenylalanyl-tRNA synthetase beta chain